MPLYMTQFAYTPEAWATLTKKPENREEVFRTLMQQLGGRLVSLYYCFGDYDGVIIFEAPEETGSILEDQNAVMHACEAETSMMMAITPDLVDRARLPEAHGPALDVAASLLPILKRSVSFKDLTSSGVAGDARRASAAKGEALLRACAHNLAERLLSGQPWSNPSQDLKTTVDARRAFHDPQPR